MIAIRRHIFFTLEYLLFETDRLLRHRDPSSQQSLPTPVFGVSRDLPIVAFEPRKVSMKEYYSAQFGGVCGSGGRVGKRPKLSSRGSHLRAGESRGEQGRELKGTSCNFVL